MDKTAKILQRIVDFNGVSLTSEDLDNGVEMANLVAHTFRTTSNTIKGLGDVVNGGGEDGLIRSAIVDGLFKTHRYLQQAVILEILQGLGDLGVMFDENPNFISDGRNAYAMKLCKKLRDTFKDDLFYKD